MAVTFTEAMVEVADCHTTLYYVGASPPEHPPLPLGNAEDYGELYAKIANSKVGNYTDIAGHPGVVLNKFTAIYRENHYWNYFFANDDLAGYPDLAWEFLVPILCSVNLRVQFALQGKLNIKVSPVPRVILYPFGWSNWLSLRLKGEFTLEDLANFNASLFADKSLQLIGQADQPLPFVLRDLFSLMSKGVRTDAFGGTETRDFAPKEPVVVTTIMEKYGSRLALNGLDTKGIQTLLRVVKPEGALPSANLGQFVKPGKYLQPLAGDDEEKYVVMKDYGRFLYLEDRLQPVERNYQHLRCYHNNTFNSLLHARHLYQLLAQAAKLKSLLGPLYELTSKANDYLVTPTDYYENASLRGFLLDPSVATVKTKIEKLYGKKTN